MNYFAIAAGVGGGAVLGYLWHRLVGCSTGACPIVRSPQLSALYGAVVGLLFSLN